MDYVDMFYEVSRMNSSFDQNLSVTTGPLDPKFQSGLELWEDIIVGSYLLLVSTLAVLLNVLVIYTCFRNWRSLNIFDFYILNLACSDVLLPLSCFPLPILSSLYHGWIFENIGCVIYGFLGFFFGIVSITTLTIMGLTRYISICHPHIDLSSKTFLRVSIIFPYVYGLLWSCVPLAGWGSYTVESYGTSCTLQWNENRIFITLMSFFCILVPTVLIFFSYGFILYRCRKSNRNIRTWKTDNSKVTRKESFLIKITFTMCWGFLVTWMPYAVVSMMSAYWNLEANIPIRVTAFAVLIAKSSVVVNPIIYVLMSKKFRPLLLHSLNLSKMNMFASKSRENTQQWKLDTKFSPVQNNAGSSGSTNVYSDSMSSGDKGVIKLTPADEQRYGEEVML